MRAHFSEQIEISLIKLLKNKHFRYLRNYLIFYFEIVLIWLYPFNKKCLGVAGYVSTSPTKNITLENIKDFDAFFRDMWMIK